MQETWLTQDFKQNPPGAEGVKYPLIPQFTLKCDSAWQHNLFNMFKCQYTS